MKNLLRKKSVIVILAFLACILICFLVFRENETIKEEAILTFETEEESSGELFFYGVTKSKGIYYVRVLTTYEEEPVEEAFLYAPLADEIDASFQEDGWVGAWSPNDYNTAKELASADKKGKITIGARFTYGATNGRMDYLAEHNYYQDSDVTGGQ